jgi:hypothetical protein
MTMKVFIVMEYFTSDEDYEVKSVEAVFTDINQAAK